MHKGNRTRSGEVATIISCFWTLATLVEYHCEACDVCVFYLRLVVFIWAPGIKMLNEILSFLFFLFFFFKLAFPVLLILEENNFTWKYEASRVQMRKQMKNTPNTFGLVKSYYFEAYIILLWGHTQHFWKLAALMLFIQRVLQSVWKLAAMVSVRVQRWYYKQHLRGLWTPRAWQHAVPALPSSWTSHGKQGCLKCCFPLSCF